MKVRGWRGLVVLTSLFIASCTGNSNTAAMIEKNFASSQNSAVDLSAALPSQWERICIAGPYSTGESIRQILGFDWNVASHSAIATSDGVSLLMFIDKMQVVTYVDYPRKSGDFSKLTGRCFNRTDAKFKVTRTGDGWLTVE